MRTESKQNSMISQLFNLSKEIIIESLSKIDSKELVKKIWSEVL